MKSKMILDRIPYQFCEGPFWGNGKMGTVLYIRNGNLCVSIDHVGLWELRETMPDEPRATFPRILQNKEAYLSGGPDYVADTNIFEEHIGRTRLPALAVELELPGEVADFRSETDLEKAQTRIHLELADGRKIVSRVWLDSCVNILGMEFEGEAGKELAVHALGWDLESPRLSTLKNWNYEPCTQRQGHDGFTVIQYFGGEMSAVLCGAKQVTEDGLFLAVGIETAPQDQERRLEEEGRRLALEYVGNKDAFLAEHEKDWAAYWKGFCITVPNERLQEAFEQEMYKLYCNEREDSSPITLQGVWNPDNRMPAWYGDLHNDLNVQSCYWPAYKTGNVRLVRPYIEYYSRAIPRLEKRAWKLFGIRDAIHAPVMMAPDGTGAASEWCYWNTLLGPELFVAVDFTWFYEYSKEKDTLREQIYPFVEKVIHLYQGIACEKEDGYLHIPFTTSPEIDRDGHMLMADDATFTLSSLHYLCRKMADYAALIGKDGSVFLEWEAKLAPVKTNEKGFPLYDGIDVFGSHRHFCQLYPIFPLCQEAHNEVADRSLDTAINQGFLEYAAFSFPYMGIMAARCGRGNMCRTMLEIYCMVFRSRNSFTVNGDPYQNGVLRISDTNAGESSDAFTLESGFFIPTALCEMFVHRAGADVWMLMGIPDEWKDCSCEDLTIEGGHRISIWQENYRIRKAVVKAAYEEKLSFHWKGDVPVKRVLKNGKEVSCFDSQGGILVCPGDEWILEYERRN